MLGYAVKRVLITVPLVALVAFGAFGLVYLIPGDTASTVAGEGASAQRIEEVREQLGLNDSFIEQFVRWVGQAITGDLGTSLVHHQSVLDIITDRAGVTLSLTLVGLLLAVLIGVPAGVAAGTRAGSMSDRIITSLTTLGIAVPAFWLAMLLVIAFALQIELFPTTGYTLLSADPLGWAESMVLPSLAICAASAADIARQTRASMAEAISLDHVRTARAMGYSRRSTVYRHALRYAGVPIAAVIGIQVERLLSAVVVVEIVFAMPGLGGFLVHSSQSQDVPVIQGIVIMIAVAVIVTNLITDLSFALINPRIRKEQ